MAEVAGFTWVDIQSLRPDWSQERCKEVFDTVEYNLHDRLVETGWDILETLVAMEEE